jgi:DNA-binding transcriptional ArsR family regulator
VKLTGSEETPRVEAHELHNPQQIKAFVHPLRRRILHVLVKEPATNQQVARALDLPPARVFHHMRSLERAGLVRLVETRVSGRNVEKFYAASARRFILKPDGEEIEAAPESDSGMDILRQDIAVASLANPADKPRVLTRTVDASREQLATFHARVRELMNELASGEQSEPSGAKHRTVIAVVTYREPGDARDA